MEYNELQWNRMEWESKETIGGSSRSPASLSPNMALNSCNGSPSRSTRRMLELFCAGLPHLGALPPTPGLQSPQPPRCRPLSPRRPNCLFCPLPPSPPPPSSSSPLPALPVSPFPAAGAVGSLRRLTPLPRRVPPGPVCLFLPLAPSPTHPSPWSLKKAFVSFPCIIKNEDRQRSASSMEEDDF